MTTPPQAEAVNVGGDLAARIEAGGKLYADNCAECHGENGEGAETARTSRASSPTRSTTRTS